VLIRSPLVGVTWVVAVLITAGLLLLLMLELAVSFIQAYVFRTLISLYIIEVNSPNF
jgi:F0F1-type ATP synthase membrane subunit a